MGDLVLTAIRDERFYILTHPELTGAIEQRLRDILNGENPTPVLVPGIDALLRKLQAANASAR